MIKRVHKSQGFTLIELMIVIAIIAIAVSASFGLSGLVKRNSLTGKINTVNSALSLARNESITRGAAVSVCSSTNSAACNGGPDWQTGWIVYEEVGVVDGIYTAATDRLIRVFPAVSGGSITLVYNSGLLIFSRKGRLRGTAGGGTIATGTFTLTDTSISSQNQKTLVVSQSGRVRMGDNETQ